MILSVHRGGLDSVHRHLAWENALLSESDPDRVDLFFYRCHPAVVLGKNQIPWRECRPGALAARGVEVARRQSGGGAVYHDPGNLNVSLLLPRARYDSGRVMRVFLDALARLGVWAACPERSRLVWQDAKISGQAFAYRRDRVLHHGTLLLDSDLSALQSALEPCPGWFDSAAVASQPMRVTNLKLPEAAVIDALIESATRQFALTPAPAAPAPWLLTLEADWDWTYGRTPAFSWRKPAGIGQPPVELRVERGRWVGWGGDGSEPLALPAAGLALRAPAWTDWLTTLPTADRVRVTGLFSEGELPPD